MICEHSASRRLIHSVAFSDMYFAIMVRYHVPRTNFNAVSCYDMLLHVVLCFELRYATVFYDVPCCVTFLLCCALIWYVVVHYIMVHSVPSMDCDDFNILGRGSSMCDAF